MIKRQVFVALILGCMVVIATGTRGESPERPGWELTFHDEFDGETLDLDKWNPRDPWGGERNNELQAYVEDAFEISDGVLHIKAEERKAEYDGEVRDYTSGMMTTYQKFAQKYGRFEIRCRVPHGQGLWPAFWLLPMPLSWPPEIDVLEILGHETDKIHFNHHFRGEDGNRDSHGGSWTGPDFSEDFHTFAVEWDAEKIVWYVDGEERFRSTQDIPQKPMYMLVNLAVGGEWPGNPNAQTPFPSSFDVDYVRVYKREDR